MHIPVLLQPVIEKLAIREGDTFLDCTVGSGGHSLEICFRFKEKVKIVGLDLDGDALKRSQKRLEERKCDFLLRRGNFQDLDRHLAKLGIKEVQRILIDLGWSSDQLESSGRGFSFLRNEPLLMTLKKKISKRDLTAKDIVNLSKEEDLSLILKNYGEEKFAGKIARRIIERRKEKPLETTFDLVEAVEESVPIFYKKRKIHPATKTFQALRIAVNNELEVLKIGLEKAVKKLSPQGRLAVISFHSLEDRIVKNFFRELKKESKAVIITKKPIIADRDEVMENPRSRSAKLRVLEKIT